MSISAVVVALVLAQPVAPGSGGGAAGAVVPAPAPEALLTEWPAAGRGGVLVAGAGPECGADCGEFAGVSHLLASEPHVAGTEGDGREIERLKKVFTDMGLEVTVNEFWPYLCYPVAAELDIALPQAMALDLAGAAAEGG